MNIDEIYHIDAKGFDLKQIWIRTKETLTIFYWFKDSGIHDNLKIELII